MEWDSNYHEEHFFHTDYKLLWPQVKTTIFLLLYTTLVNRRKKEKETFKNNIIV